jgi:hypothetical protein
MMREYPLKTANIGPHGLTLDRDGNVWYTGNYSGLITSKCLDGPSISPLA